MQKQRMFGLPAQNIEFQHEDLSKPGMWDSFRHGTMMKHFDKFHFHHFPHGIGGFSSGSPTTKV